MKKIPGSASPGLNDSKARKLRIEFHQMCQIFENNIMLIIEFIALLAYYIEQIGFADKICYSKPNKKTTRMIANYSSSYSVNVIKPLPSKVIRFSLFFGIGVNITNRNHS